MYDLDPDWSEEYYIHYAQADLGEKRDDQSNRGWRETASPS